MIKYDKNLILAIEERKWKIPLLKLKERKKRGDTQLSSCRTSAVWWFAKRYQKYEKAVELKNCWTKVWNSCRKFQMRQKIVVQCHWTQSNPIAASYTTWREGSGKNYSSFIMCPKRTMMACCLLRDSMFHRSQAEYLLLLFSLPHISDISTLIFPLYDAYLIKFHSDG